MKYVIGNCDIYTGNKTLYDKAIVVKDDKIEALVDIDKVPKEFEFVDLEGLNISPGFIDLQVNGGGGCLFNDNPSEDCISKIYDGHKRYGTVNFLPTLFTVSQDKIMKGIESVRKCIKKKSYGVLGIHLEGPYINEKKAGVHDKKYIKSISVKELQKIVAKGKDVIKIFTLAPEMVKKEHVKLLKDNGIVISAGHTMATYQQSIDSFKMGFSNVTHLFNAMSQFGSREPGLVGAVYDTDNIWAGIIVDGFHVHFASVRISKKIKKNKLFLITDAMPPVGSDISKFKLGDLNVYHDNGKCVTKDGILAGSALDMSKAVRNCVQKVGIPIDETLRMASTYPAQIIGKGNILGKIEKGYYANLTIFTNQLAIKGIVSHGKYEEFK